MRFTIYQKRLLSVFLILLLGLSGIWTGKNQANACLCYHCLCAQEMHPSIQQSAKKSCRSQAGVYKKIQAVQKEYARLEETGLKISQQIGRIIRGSRTEQGRGNASFVNFLAGIPLSVYRHQIKYSLKYCLTHRLQGAGWQTIISYIHRKDGAKGGKPLGLTDILVSCNHAFVLQRL